MRRLSRWAATGPALVAGVTALVSCVGDDPQAGGSSSSGSGGSSSGDPGSSSSGGGGSDDGGSSGGGSSGGGSSGAPCVESCVDATTLRQCVADTPTTVLCGSGCSTEGSPHCKQFDPLGSFAANDFTRAGLADLALDLEYLRIDLATGEITDSRPAGGSDAGDAGPNVVREANGNPEVDEVHAGISFVIDASGAYLRARNITITDSDPTRARSWNTNGDRPLRLLAQDTVRVEAVVDVPCGATFGGFAGASAGIEGGAGPGLAGTPAASPNSNGKISGAVFDKIYGGGGGGGHKGSGGPGGAGAMELAVSPFGAAGIGYPDAVFGSFAPLFGGAGGGPGSRRGGTGPLLLGSNGGGGGGAIQLVAGRLLVIGSDAEVEAGINAGGCGGGAKGNAVVMSAVESAGGGGGAGGTIVLEAPRVEVKALGGVTANGGGGGGHGGRGANGQRSTIPALGGGVPAPVGPTCPGGGCVSAPATTCSANGGNGAAGNTDATTGAQLTGSTLTSCAEANNAYGGGGGGAAGRILVNTLDDDFVRANGSIVSPIGTGLKRGTLAPN